MLVCEQLGQHYYLIGDTEAAKSQTLHLLIKKIKP